MTTKQVKLIGKSTGNTTRMTTFCPVCIAPVVFRNQVVLKYTSVQDGILCDTCRSRNLQGELFS